MIKKISLVSILFIALIFRLYLFVETFGFYGDQGQDLLLILKWFKTGEILTTGIMTSIGTFHIGPMYHYMIAPFVWFLNGSLISPVWFFLICGILLVFIGFLIGSEFANLETAIVFGLLMAVNPHLIALSKGAYNPNLQALLCLSLLYLLLKFFKTGKLKLIFLIYLIIGIGVQFHYVFLANLIICSLVLIIFFPRGLLDYKIYLLALVGFILPLIPFFVGQYMHNFVDLNNLYVYLGQSDQRKSTILTQTIIDRLTFPFLIYFSSDKFPYFLSFFVKPFFIGITIFAGILAFSKSKFSFLTKVSLVYFLISVVVALFARLQFWWWYHGFFSVLSLVLVVIFVSYLLSGKNTKYLGIVLLSIFVWWQLFYSKDIYRIDRSARTVEVVSNRIVEDIRLNKLTQPVKIWVLSYVSVAEGYEYRYLLEKNGVETANNIDPGKADYIIVEKDLSGDIKFDENISKRMRKIANLKLDNPYENVKYVDLYKITPKL